MKYANSKRLKFITNTHRSDGKYIILMYLDESDGMCT
jgi:hypothetical protein